MGWVSPIFLATACQPEGSRGGESKTYKRLCKKGGELIYKGRSFDIFTSYGLFPNQKPIIVSEFIMEIVLIKQSYYSIYADYFRSQLENRNFKKYKARKGKCKP